MNRFALWFLLCANALLCLAPRLLAESPEEVLPAIVAPSPAAAETYAEAQRLFREKSYALAEPLLAELLKDPALTQESEWAVRWLWMESQRRALTRWDLNAIEKREELQQGFRELAEEMAAGEERPLPLWAQARMSEALLARGLGDAEAAHPVVAEVLDYWAASLDVETARHAYLQVVFTWAEEDRSTPVGWLENAVKIARSPYDRARAHHLLAQRLERERDVSQSRVGDELRAAYEAAPETALFAPVASAYADWLQKYGHSSYDDAGNLILEPDYVAALAVYERLLARKRVSGPYASLFEDAYAAGSKLKERDLSVMVPYSFRPSTEPAFLVRWRNLEEVRVRAFRVDPVDDPLPLQIDDWKPGTNAAPVWEQTLTTPPRRPYYEVVEEVRIGQPLPPGAYAIEVSSARQRDVELLFVTDLVLVGHSSENKGIIYAAHADTGAPVPGAELRVMGRTRVRESLPDGAYIDKLIQDVRVTADHEGLVKLELHEGDITIYAKDAAGNQALMSHSTYRPYSDDDDLRVYVITDRPAYRPGETVHWKAIVRNKKGNLMEQPTRRNFYYMIECVYDESVVLAEGNVELNTYGTFSGSCAIPPNAPLGLISLALFVPTDNTAGNILGEAYMARVEEYRLPDFRVTIELTGPGGVKATEAAPGDRIEGTIQVDYYSGGAVSDAPVEVSIRRNTVFTYLNPRRDFHWYFSDMDSENDYDDSYESEKMDSLELRTDSRGRVTFRFDTLRDSERDWRYVIKARVTDAARREVEEVVGATITRQGYFAHLDAERVILRPGETAPVAIYTLDANDEPVTAEGQLKLTRERWRQVYIHTRRGNEISGEAYRELPERSMLGTAQSDYRLKEEGFVTEQLWEGSTRTNANGEGEYLFEAPEPGYYRLSWFSRGKRGQPIQADTHFWVSREGDSRIDYQPDGVEILTDVRPFRVGEKVPVLLMAPTPNRYVLLSRQNTELRDTQLIHLEGTARLLMWEIQPDDVFNTYLHASLVADESVTADTASLVVPPVDKFLTVQVRPDAEGYEPQSPARYSLEVTDHEGLPVSAEVSLGVVDEAIFAMFRSGFDARWLYRDYNYDNLSFDSSINDNTFYRPMVSTFSAPTDEEFIEFDPFMVEGDDTGFAATTTAGVRSRDAASTTASFEEDALLARLRENFQTTAFWAPAIVTDAEGKAEVSFTFPDNLTEWRATAVALTPDSRIGGGQTSVATRLPLIARLNAPRFLTVGDTAWVTGVFNNNTEDDLTVTATLESSAAAELAEASPRTIIVPAGGIGRVEWPVRAVTPGELALTLTGTSSRHSDAEQRKLPVVAHGMTQHAGVAGRVGAEQVRAVLNLPPERAPGTTEVEVTLSPSVAMTTLQALPYLLEYPYGCTEQVLSRFVPAVVVRQTLLERQYSLEDFQKAVQAAAGPAPERDITELDAILADGLKRLRESQKEDGSWPWMPGGSSDTWMTAYAVWALTLAERAGLSEATALVEPARAYLEKQLFTRASPASRAWYLHALASRFRGVEGGGQPSRLEARAYLDLMAERERLPAYARALLTLCAVDYGFREDAELLARNLRNGAQRGKLPDGIDVTGGGFLPTVYWGGEADWGRWENDPLEATAWSLLALLEVDPDGDFIQSVVSWLIQNRKNAYWGHTRATAVAVLALNRYVEWASELSITAAYRLELNGQPLAELEVDPANLLAAAARFPVPEEMLREGENVLQVTRLSGTDPLSFAFNATWYTSTAPIAAQGSQLHLYRDYLQAVPVPTLLQGYQEKLVALPDEAAVESGDRLEVVLTLEVPADVHYLRLSDLKPAGFESVQFISGEAVWARELDPEKRDTLEPEDRYRDRRVWVYQELRDRQVNFFIDRLPAGLWEIRYQLRAESPGTLHALPAQVEAMYAPSLNANSAERIFTVTDARE